jgi:hypothetical protein
LAAALRRMVHEVLLGGRTRGLPRGDPYHTRPGLQRVAQVSSPAGPHERLGIPRASQETFSSRPALRWAAARSAAVPARPGVDRDRRQAARGAAN